MSRPAVIFGGPSPEHDISILTGLLAARTLREAGDAVYCLYWSKSGEFYEVDVRLEGEDFVAGIPRGARPVRLVTGADGGFKAAGGLRSQRHLEISAAINCCHGAPGEDGTLQGALDSARVPHAGPSVRGAALGMDKLAFGAVVNGAGLRSLPRVLVPGGGGWDPPFEGPYIVKPRFGGSSIGIEVVADAETIAAVVHASVHLRAGAVVEPYLDGADDVSIAVRAYPSVQLSAIVRPQRGAASAEFYSYRDKYVPGQGMAAAPQEVNPALAAGVAEAIRDAAQVLVDVACVRGIARLDFLVHGGELYVNEINTIPGSLAKHLWVDPPTPFAALLYDMIAEAMHRRVAEEWTTAGADGSALRSAASIAAKLG